MPHAMKTVLKSEAVSLSNMEMHLGPKFHGVSDTVASDGKPATLKQGPVAPQNGDRLRVCNEITA